MLRYQKGYVFMGQTFVVKKSDIHNAHDEDFVDATALLPVPDSPTRAERFRAMSEEELEEDKAEEVTPNDIN